LRWVSGDSDESGVGAPEKRSDELKTWRIEEKHASADVSCKKVPGNGRRATVEFRVRQVLFESFAVDQEGERHLVWSLQGVTAKPRRNGLRGHDAIGVLSLR
jgi:hypothetical protein